MTKDAKRATRDATKLRRPIPFDDALRAIVRVKPKPKQKGSPADEKRPD